MINKETNNTRLNSDKRCIRTSILDGCLVTLSLVLQQELVEVFIETAVSHSVKTFFPTELLTLFERQVNLHVLHVEHVLHAH